ncbi:hypothetical protein [Phenylobacterium sp. 58.2.17]|uniref:hypothetical protein n=1 Tax=Phenylobacterium sp. 58.2.17 TaxID=2969306 RepID=UPI002264EE4C|nr:hypothetical protein [Phenylobacterium sp. 58.2.17]MCX7587786.1 hypothetical protein [Phenylobacterium sp. 58.2.17]
MSDQFDALVARLATAPTDHPLDLLDGEIARGIERRRRDAQTLRTLAPMQMASLCLAMVVGVTTGGALALNLAKPEPLGAFFSASSLAPSTLLEGVQ